MGLGSGCYFGCVHGDGCGHGCACKWALVWLEVCMCVRVWVLECGDGLSMTVVVGRGVGMHVDMGVLAFER